MIANVLSRQVRFVERFVVRWRLEMRKSSLSVNKRERDVGNAFRKDLESDPGLI